MLIFFLILKQSLPRVLTFSKIIWQQLKYDISLSKELDMLSTLQVSFSFNVLEATEVGGGGGGEGGGSISPIPPPPPHPVSLLHLCDISDFVF